MSTLEQPPGQTKAVPLYRNRDYMLLLGGQFLSYTGSQTSQFAFPLLVLLVTGSAAWAGIAGGLVVMPLVVLSLPAGALVDRWDRKRLMIVCDVGRALILASIPAALFLGHLTLVQLCLCALAEGTFYAFFNLAETSALPRVVAKEQLPAAGSQDMAAKNAAMLLGPLFGGLLLGLQRALPFLVDAATYVVSVFSLAFIRTAFQQERRLAQQHLWADIRQGVAWLWQQPLLCFLAVLACVGNALDNCVIILVIVLATRAHAGPAASGVIVAVAGTAAFLGSLAAERVQMRIRFGPLLIAAQWISFLMLPLFLLSSSIVALGVAATVQELISGISGTAQYTYRLSRIPDELQGRVNSVYRLIALGAFPSPLD